MSAAAPAAAARDWEVPRVAIASTIGVYGGAGAGAGALREDMPLPLTASHQIPAFKKCNELLGGYLADAYGIEGANLRTGAVWGRSGGPLPASSPPRSSCTLRSAGGRR